MTLALIKEKQKDYAGAAEAYEKVLAFKGNSMPALNNLSYLYSERLNQSAKALELARKARALAPASESAWRRPTTPARRTTRTR